MKILLSTQAYLKLKYYSLQCNTEISGLGLIHINNKNIIVDDIYLINQQASYASTELDKKSVALFLQEQHKKGIDTSLIKLWWHSHVKMDVFWSITDDSAIECLGDTSNLIVSIVINHQLDMLGRIDVFNPIRITLDDVPVKLNIVDNNLKKQIKKEIKQKVNNQIFNRKWNWKKHQKKR